MEIERKFIINQLPDNLASYISHKLEQAYICTEPVIRIRKMDNDFILTIKSKGLLSREEYELPLDEVAYNSLMKKTDGNIISKTRYIIPLENNLCLELDIFDGSFKGLVIGEIEFKDECTAKKYNPPAYLSKEVTFDSRYHNSSMSKMSEVEIKQLLS